MKPLLPFLILIYFTACQKTNDTTPPSPKSSDKDIISFVFKSLNNSNLVTDITGSITTDSIFVTFPAGTIVTNLIPTITISGKTISPTSLSAQNFTNPVNYTVMAEDGSTKKYSVKISVIPPVIDATVYIGTTTLSQFTPTAYLYAINANSGIVKWKYLSASGFVSTPTFSNGILYACDMSGDLLAFDPNNGTLKWSYKTGKSIASTPTVVNGIIYFANDNQELYAIDVVTHLLKWKYILGTTRNGSFSSPTVVNGIVYIGTQDGNIFAIEASTGNLKWKTYNTYGYGVFIVSSPSVVNNVLYVGDGDRNLLALNTPDGTFKWVYSSNTGPLYSSPTVVNGVIYVGAELGSVYAVDANSGTLKWKYFTTSTVRSSPFVSNGVVYFGDRGPNKQIFYAVDAITGTLKWKFISEYEFDTSPVIFNGIIYVPSFDQLFALNTTDGSLKWKYVSDGSRYLQTSPCVVDVNGNVFHPGISGDQN